MYADARQAGSACTSTIRDAAAPNLGVKLMVKLLPTQLTAAMQNCELEKESFQGTILEEWQVICESTLVLCLW